MNGIRTKNAQYVDGNGYADIIIMMNDIDNFLLRFVSVDNGKKFIVIMMCLPDGGLGNVVSIHNDGLWRVSECSIPPENKSRNPEKFYAYVIGVDGE